MDTELNSDIILSVDIISFLIGFPSNVLALYAFSVKIRSKPRPVDILLLNLTVSDLLFLIFLSLKMHEAASDWRWNLPSVLCSITAFIFFWTIHTSSLLLMAVSVIRYIGVAFPINYLQLQRPLYAVVIGAVCWIIAGAHCTIVFIIQKHPDLANNTARANDSICYREFSEKQLEVLLPMRLEMFIVFCLVPLIVCIYCYLHCIWILYRQPRFSQNQKRKSIGMALGTLAVFLVCVIPYNSSHVVGFFEHESPTWRPYALLLSTFNTCIDPIIFCFSSSAFSFFKKHGFAPTAMIQEMS